MESKLNQSIYDPKGKVNLSLAGCGFLGIYHVGVASCFKKYAPYVYKEKIAGSSAGALVASALIADLSLGDCATFVLNLSLECRKRFLGPFHPNFHLVQNLRKALEEFLPANVHILATNRLHISITKFPDFKNELVSKFNSKEDLIDALICSSYVPFYSGVAPPYFRGKPYMDGGISDNLPMLDNWTIKVSPFAGESDICPSDQSDTIHHVTLLGTSAQINCNNAYRGSVAFLPPPPEVLSQMCQNGFEDALRFLKKKGMISCQQHISIHSAINSSHPFHLNTLDERSVHRENQKIINSAKKQRLKKDSVLIIKTDDIYNKNFNDNGDDDDDDNDSGNSSNSSGEDNVNNVKQVVNSDNATTNDNNNNNKDKSEDHQSSHNNIFNKKRISNDNDNDDCNSRSSLASSSSSSSSQSHHHHLHHHECEDCELLSRSSVNEGPPSIIIKALDDACIEANKGFFARFYRYHYLAYMAAPYIIPCSFTYAVCKRLLMWTPYAPDDLKWFTAGAYNFILDLLESRKVTSPLVKNERLVSWLSVLGSYCGMHRCDKKEFFSLIFPDYDAIVGGKTDESDAKLGAKKSPEKEKVLLHVKQSSRTESDQSHDKPEDVSFSTDQLNKSINFSHVDSFDNCLHINNQIDAILSYCYLEDEHSTKVKVIEIMPLQEE